MELYTRQIGGYGDYPAKIIELTVINQGTTTTEGVTDLKGRVDENLIQSLREIADELEEHNANLYEKLKLSEKSQPK